MPLGARLRDWLGPWEGPVSRWSRAAFFDADHFAREVRAWTSATNIVEIGCGVGHVTEALAAAFPTARIAGVDLNPRIGRLFNGDSRRVEFYRQTAQDFALGRTKIFDLIVLSDVIHHVPRPERSTLLKTVFELLAPGGAFVLKDWEPTRTPIHFLAYCSDRYITGDRVHCERPHEHRARVQQAAPHAKIEREIRLRPWRNNNFALLVRSRHDEVARDEAIRG